MGQKKRGTYWYDLLVAFDQLGNALAGGNPDVTISARIGYNANIGNTNLWLWKVLEAIVNFTFYLVDGKGHCLQAYNFDTVEDYASYNNKLRKGNDFLKLYYLL